MEGFISDEEMASLDPQSAVKPKGFLTDDEMKAHEEASLPSKLESGLRGLAQGASMGFADEITGGLESAFTDKTYDQARDESRAAYHAAEKQNPGSYLTGQLAGSVAPLAIPGVGIAKGAGTAAAIGKAAVTGGVLGGLTGVGTSEKDNLGGIAGDALTGAGIGSLAGVAGTGGSKLVQAAAPKVAGAIEGATNFVKDKGAPLLDRVGDAAEAGAAAYGGLTGDWKPAGVISGARRLGGGAIAKMAGSVAEKLPDILRASPEVLGKYAQPLMSALERGGTSFAATNFILQSTDPEYRKMLTEMEENQR
jgi:hypothetical protein